MELTPTESSQPRTHDRWRFFRDVLVFQLKMLLDNVRDFALMPVSLAAAVIDLVFRGNREGACFYKILEWGAHSERVIDVYSALERRGIDTSLNHDYTVDTLISKVEGVIVREFEKGGTAASVKLAVDRAIDSLQGGAGDRARNLVKGAADKLRTGVKPLPNDDDSAH
ncbi:MAG TPA: hypothetical protein VJ719_16650 [Chthoniobacterales bacterium]|nr:hypothetical protein [Chthoniobacterales bacterium]